MPEAKISKHVGGSTELTLIAPIRQELVKVSHMTLSHATRLRMLFGVLFASAKATAEKSTLPYRFPHALERLEVLHFVRYGLIENDRKLLLCVAYDGGAETYLRDQIVGKAGPILDAIFCHCEDYRGHSSDLGYPKFNQWVGRNTEEVQYWYSGFPDRSVSDIRYLEEFEQIQREDRGRNLTTRDRLLAEHRARARAYPALDPPQQVERCKKLLELTSALYDLDGVFAPDQDERKYLQRASSLLVAELALLEIPAELQEQYPDQLKWIQEGFADLKRVLPSQMDVEHPRVERGYEKQAQGGILSGYPEAPLGALLFLRMRDPDAARQFLTDFVPTSDADAAASLEARNIALTYEGLARLGLSEQDRARLPSEFVQGMAERAGLLGDVGMSHPSKWKLLEPNWPLGAQDLPPVPLSAVDFVVQLRTAPRDESPHEVFTEQHPLYEAVEAIANDPGLDLLSVLPVRRQERLDEQGNSQVHEHFGFADGLSQPHTRDASDADRDADWTPLGEFLLGHPNWKGNELEIPDGFENGSFLVVRKLKQNVSALDEFERENAKRLPSSDGRPIAEILMGRRRDGAPLAAGEADWDNVFDYESDALGRTTPHLSHVRRANPRRADTKTRILRRGLSYRSGDDAGLVFMAYNASIAQQFEVVQRWLSGNSPSGTYSGERDPFLAVPRAGESRWLRVLHEDKVVRVKLPEQPFATLEWGLYLFAPSLAGLKRLAAQPPQPAALASSAAPGEDQLPRESILRQMKFRDSLPGESEEQTLDRWRTLLEDPRAYEPSGNLWSDVRKVGGASRTGYGVLVGSLELVREVLNDETHFSVREYWTRMNESLGALHLGMDHEPRESETPDELDRRYTEAVGSDRYEEEQSFLNPWLGNFPPADAFEASRQAMSQLLSDRTRIMMPGLAFELVASLSRGWFGLPDEQHVYTTRVGTVGRDASGAEATCPGDFNAVARYVFWPHPTQTATIHGKQRGWTLQQAATSFLDAQTSGNPHPFIERLLSEHPGQRDLVQRILLGAIHGFVAPTAGNFASVASQWAGGELHRLQRGLLRHDSWPDPGQRYQRARDVIEQPLICEMQQRPVPDLLHRTAIATTQLRGVEIRPGDRIVVGLRSAATEQPGEREILFGGNYDTGGSATRHACAGQEMAIGALLGAFSALLEEHTIEIVHSRLWKVAPR